MIGIYKITSKTTGKIYVGQSINIKKRFYEHTYQAFNRNELGYNSILHQAMRKYGAEDFSFEIIEECSVDQLDEREKYWIKELNTLSPNGYNILAGGQIKRAEILLCKECGKPIDKSSKSGLCRSCWVSSQRQRRPTKEELYSLLKENNGNFSAVGRQYGVCCNAVRKWCKQYELPFHSPEYKEKQEKKSTKRSVYQLNKNTLEIIAKYDSINDAARAVGKTKGGHITEVCQGKLQSAFGYKWRYVDEERVQISHGGPNA